MKALCLLLAAATSVGAQISIEPARPETLEITVFGGDEAILQLRCESPSDGVTYDLLQISGQGLAAPLASNQVLDLPAGIGASDAFEVRLPVPEVKRPTRMLLRFHPAKNASGPATAQAFLDVFPHPASGEWRDTIATAEKSSHLRLAVFGKSQRVRDFLAKNDIAFHDFGPEFPQKFPSDALVLGEVTPTTLERHRPEPTAGRQIFFVDAPLVLPGVFESRGPEGTLSKVTLPIPAGLASDPKSQTTFIDLLHRNLEPTTP